jgi:hypothetical protein
MIFRAVPMRRTGRNVLVVGSRVLLAGALVALSYLAARILFAAVTGGLRVLGSEAALWNLALAAMIYLVGHGLRILRLALLIGGWRVGFLTIVSFHFMTAAVSLAAPLKLGEVYRVVELKNVVGALTRALAIVWWERAFDVSVILTILFLALARASGTIPHEFITVGVLAIAFIALTALTFFVVPDNLRRLSVLIIRRYNSSRTVPVLRLIDQVRTTIQQAPRMVHAKVASLVTLTILIWTCEISCFAIVLPGVTLGAALDSLLNFLSTVTRGETLLAALGKGEATSFSENAQAYLAATQIPLVFCGLGAALHYVSWRMKQSR